MNKSEVEFHSKFNYSEIADRAIREFHANQDVGVLISLLSLLSPMEPKIILEIGTNTGGMAWALSQILAPEGKVITIDVTSEKKIRSIFDENNNNNIFFIEGNSHDPRVLKDVFYATDQDVAGQEIDILFIDGDHSFEGTMKDFELYYSLVRKNGVICFHDLSTTAFPEPGKVWSDIIEVDSHEWPYKKWCELYIHRWPDQNNPEEIWKPSIGIIFKEE